jgi:hypothetical protein
MSRKVSHVEIKINSNQDPARIARAVSDHLKVIK